MATPFTRVALRVTRELHGVVVSAGLMQNTIKVRVGGQKFNKFLNKWFAAPKQYLVHDPNSSLRLGDVVAITPGWRTSRMKRHVVKRIIAPAGIPIEQRPPIPTEAERIALYEQKRMQKDERRAQKKAESIGNQLRKKPLVKGKTTPVDCDVD